MRGTVSPPPPAVQRKLTNSNTASTGPMSRHRGRIRGEDVAADRRPVRGLESTGSGDRGGSPETGKDQGPLRAGEVGRWLVGER
jgi:hypothetical protein